MPLKPLKWYKKLSSRRNRLESGAFVVEGDRAIRQIMQASPESILEIVAMEDPPMIYRDYPVRILPESQFLSICHTRTPQGIMAVVRLPYDTYSDSLPEITGNKILLLEDVQDPGNTGTLIRTAAAFGFSGVIMTEGCAEPFSPKAVQSSAGSLLSIWLRRTADYLEMVNKLKESDFILAAADVNGTDGPAILGGRDKLVLALGNEAAGLSGELMSLADYRVAVPTDRDKAESLNVAACGAILMFLAA
jgi:TrmH family RNA methyltransferase